MKVVNSYVYQNDIEFAWLTYPFLLLTVFYNNSTLWRDKR